MTNLQAAIGLAQLERLDEFVARKREMGRRYTEALAPLRDRLQLPLVRTDFADNIYWVYGMVLDDAMPFDATEMMRRLAMRKIGSRPFFWSMHEQPVFVKMGMFGGERYPVAERLARRGFYVPSGMALSAEQIAYVATTLPEVLL